MSGKATLKSFKAMLAEAKLPERTVEICLRGDLVAEHEELNRQLEFLEQKAVDTLAGNGGAELAEQIAALEAQMRDNTHPFRLRALSGPRFREFKAKYPPRLEEDDPQKRDRVFEFNADTGFEPLVRLCLVDPELDDGDWAELMQALTENQFDSLAAAAWLLNKGEIDVPFSRAASRLNRLIAADSKPPNG